MTKQNKPRQRGRLSLCTGPVYPVQLYRVPHKPKPLLNLKHWMPEYEHTLTMTKKAKTK